MFKVLYFSHKYQHFDTLVLFQDTLSEIGKLYVLFSSSIHVIVNYFPSEVV